MTDESYAELKKVQGWYAYMKGRKVSLQETFQLLISNSLDRIKEEV